MKSYRTIAVILFSIIIVFSGIYFYYIGGFGKQNNTEVTIVKKILSNNSSENTGEQFDQSITTINQNIAKFKDMSQEEKIKPIIEDLKSF